MGINSNTLLLSFLISFALLVVFVSVTVLIRFGIFKYRARKTAQLAAASLSNVCVRNNNIPLSSITSEQSLSDHELDIHRLNTVTPPTEIVQEEHYLNVQLEFERNALAQERRDAYERLAQERREAFDWHTLHIPHPLIHERRTENGQHFPNALEESPDSPERNRFDLSPVPRYVFKDDQLPSYEQAISTDDLQ